MNQKSEIGWDAILEKLDKIIELIKTIKKEGQLYRRTYEETEQ